MLIATEDVVYGMDEAGEHEPQPVYHRGHVRRVEQGQNEIVVAREDNLIIVLRGSRSNRIETGIEGSIHSLLLLEEDPLHLLIGTEPPHVYRLREESVERIESFDELECREDWYTPWGGPAAVRSMARTDDGWAYADIHVGSIMRSPDEGATWEPVTPELHVDVHQVATCPADDDRVYAQTADAFWISYDRGDSWTHRAEDLDERYGRCVTVHPEDPDLVLCTVSDGPHGDNVHGQLYRSEDAGRNWSHVADGFPGSTVDNIDTFHVEFSPHGQAWAAVGHTLYVGRNRAREWEPFWDAPEPITMLSCHRQ
ncbi:MAG: hypothetical protein R6X33_12370 [Candidatus Brocadiia bacterium]